MQWEEKRRQWELAQLSNSKNDLPAASALEVPAAWRKSLGRKKPPRGQRELFSELEDDTPLREEQPPAPRGPNGEEPSK